MKQISFMKKIMFLLLDIVSFSLLFIGCKNPNSLTGGAVPPPAYYAVVSGIVVNEEGTPIPNIRYTDENYYNIEWQNNIITDENGIFNILLSSRTAGTDSLVNIAFVDIDGEENGSYETLHVATTKVELVWNGKKYGEEPLTNELFKPIDLGTFVMKKKAKH